MKTPYVVNYQAPVKPWWESSATELAGHSGDLENLLQQAREDVNALGEAVIRLEGELRSTKIDKVVAQKKIEAISKLIQELSLLKREETAAVFENTPHQPDPAAQPEHHDEKPKHRKIRIWLALVAAVVLAGISVVVFAANNEPGAIKLIDHITTSLQPILNRFFH
jgi:hypothetical protein